MNYFKYITWLSFLINWTAIEVNIPWYFATGIFLTALSLFLALVLKKNIADNLVVSSKVGALFHILLSLLFVLFLSTETDPIKIVHFCIFILFNVIIVIQIFSSLKVKKGEM